MNRVLTDRGMLLWFADVPMRVNILATLEFATFWQGELSPLEIACIRSFPRTGYPITVYSYCPISGLPDGVISANAEDIVPVEYLKRFIFDGKPNLSHFTDYFRYRLFQRTDSVWVDTDVLMIRDFTESLPATILARETQPVICGAFMRISRNDTHLDALVKATEALVDRELLWGQTGPLLLTKEFGKAALMRQAIAPERFYAIGFEDFWKVFLPEYAEECAAQTIGSWTIHLWNNIIDNLGFWKRLAPPEGSFLYEKLKEQSAIELFDAVYPEKIMQRIVDNFLFRKSGQDLGIKQLLTQIVPSARRTIRHYKKN